jgi:hypothetical protein
VNGQALLSIKPVAEVVVEGELSPFEHEALHRLLKRAFAAEPPSYIPFGYGEESLSTRINITFHYPYSQDFFTKHLKENWRELKDLIKEVRYRRGRAGAAFTFTFVQDEFRLIFRSGEVDHDQISSAMDQIGHLTGIVGRMLKPETLPEAFGMVECKFDSLTDRWDYFRATNRGENNVYEFDEESSNWRPAKV